MGDLVDLDSHRRRREIERRGRPGFQPFDRFFNYEQLMERLRRPTGEAEVQAWAERSGFAIQSESEMPGLKLALGDSGFQQFFALRDLPAGDGVEPLEETEGMLPFDEASEFYPFGNLPAVSFAGGIGENEAFLGVSFEPYDSQLRLAARFGFLRFLEDRWCMESYLDSVGVSPWTAVLPRRCELL